MGTTAPACRAAVLTSCSTSGRRIRHGSEQLSVDQTGGRRPLKHGPVRPSTWAAGPAAHSASPVSHGPDWRSQSIWSVTRSTLPPTQAAGPADRSPRQSWPSRSRPGGTDRYRRATSLRHTRPSAQLSASSQLHVPKRLCLLNKGSDTQVPHRQKMIV